MVSCTFNLFYIAFFEADTWRVPKVMRVLAHKVAKNRSQVSEGSIFRHLTSIQINYFALTEPFVCADAVDDSSDLVPPREWLA